MSTYRSEMSNRYSSAQYLNGALVGLGGALVLLLVDLVTSGVEGTGGTVGERVLAGDVALGLLLVALLGGLSGLALDGLGDVVGGVLDRVDGRADEALVGLVGVGSRHVDKVGGVGWFEGGSLFGSVEGDEGLMCDEDENGGQTEGYLSSVEG